MTGLAISIGDLDDGSEGTFSSTVVTPNGREARAAEALKGRAAI